MSIKNKKIYVLGGSGTIGLPVAKFLKDNGAKVINLDINNSNNDFIFEKIDVRRRPLKHYCFGVALWMDFERLGARF